MARVERNRRRQLQKRADKEAYWRGVQRGNEGTHRRAMKEAERVRVENEKRAKKGLPELPSRKDDIRRARCPTALCH